MNATRLFARSCVLIAVTFTVGFSKPKSRPDVLVVPHTFEENEHLIVRPEPGKPVYYLIVQMKTIDLGEPVAGIQYPNPTVVRSEMVRALAAQGYLETKIGGPMPGLILIASWGHANMSTLEMTEADPNDPDEKTTTTFGLNKIEMARLIGLHRLGDVVNKTDSEAREINELINSDRFYVSIGALDAKAWLKKEKKVLWRTHISIYSHREDLNDSLHLMITDAAPYFGREEEHAVKINDAFRRSSVKLGETKFLDEVPSPAGETNK